MERNFDKEFGDEEKKFLLDLFMDSVDTCEGQVKINGYHAKVNTKKHHKTVHLHRVQDCGYIYLDAMPPVDITPEEFDAAFAVAKAKYYQYV